MIKNLKTNLSIIIYLLLSFILFFTGCQRENLSIPGDYDITCYAATYGKGIYKSDNGGTSWFPVEGEQKDIYAYFKRLYLSPNNKDMLYVTTTGVGLFTLDLKTGALALISRFKDENVTSVTFKGISYNRQNSFEVLVGMNDGGIFKSTNAPMNWQPYYKGLTYRDVNVLFTHEKSLYTGTAKDLFKWDMASNGWVSTSEGIKNKNIISIDYDPQGKILYAGSGPYGDKKGLFEDIPCLYKSTNEGKTWAATDKGIPDGTLVYVIAINPNRFERIYLGTSDGVYRSTDKGRNWLKMKYGLPKGLRVFDIKIARVSDGKDVVYAAGSNGVYMTVDDDETLELAWFDLGAAPPTAPWYAAMVADLALGRKACSFERGRLGNGRDSKHFFQRVRRHIGQAPFVMPAAAAFIRDGAGRVLLQRRADTGDWGLSGGGMELGERVDQTVVNEVREETGLEVEPVRLVSIGSDDVFWFVYPHGDQVKVVSFFFECRVVGGQLRADGAESLEVRFFSPDALPPMIERHTRRVRQGLAGREEAFF